VCIQVAKGSIYIIAAQGEDLEEGEGGTIEKIVWTILTCVTDIFKLYSL
jgi:hypothetical protein